MESLKIRVRADRDAALAGGKILDDFVEFDVSPETLGDLWPELVSLDPLHGAIYGINVIGDDIESLKKALMDHRQVRIDWEMERTTRLTNRLAELQAIDPATIQLEDGQEKYNLDTDEISDMAGCYPAPAVKAPYIAESSNDCRDNLEHRELIKNINALVHSLRIQIAARVDAENRRLYLEAKPTLLAQREQDRASIAKAETEKAEQEAMTKAQRLAQGIVIFNYGDYNSRRYGSPWGAKVSLDAGKLKYDFSAATVTAQWGKAGTVEIPCEVGEIVATGQKDYRNPSNNVNELYQLQADGSLKELSRTEAVQALRK